jgi:hypothetical protein
VADTATKTSPRELFQSLVNRNAEAPTRDHWRKFYIDFGTKDGNRYALKYTDIKWIKLVGGNIIDIHFATHHVEIHGTRLALLYEQLLREEVHKLDAVDERLLLPDPSGARSPGGPNAAPVIRKLVVMQKPDGAEKRAMAKGQDGPGGPLGESESNPFKT